MRYHPDDGPEPEPKTVTAHIVRRGMLFTAKVDLRADLDCSVDETEFGIADYDELAEWLNDIRYGQLAERARWQATRQRVAMARSEMPPIVGDGQAKPVSPHWNNNDTVKCCQLATDNNVEPTDEEYIAEAIEMTR